MAETGRTNRWILAGLGGLAVAYCVLVLGLVATTPDLRLRFLLVDDPIPVGDMGTNKGIRVRVAPEIDCGQGPQIETGDVIQVVDGRPISNLLDFARLQLSLRNQEIPPNGHISAETNPLASGLPSLVQHPDGSRWIHIEFHRPALQKNLVTTVRLQSAPTDEVGMTLIWFLLQLIFFSVGALAFWSRPFDEAARRFFVMCTATLPAFVGGFHWATVSGSIWLTLPFAMSGILLPAVTLHFFLVYPRTKPLLSVWPRGVIGFLYGVPGAAVVCFGMTEVLIWSLMMTSANGDGSSAQTLLLWLNILRWSIYAYLGVAAIHFVATIASLIHSALTTRNPIERSQLRPILIAGLTASGCIGYALWLAIRDRESFALGGARTPMFLASIVFMLAYAIAIIRYKLMLIDQIVSKGMWYYVMSYGATAAVALTIAVGSFAVASRKAAAQEQQTWIVSGILMLAVILLIWLRDSWQHLVDRRFFREKYQLDKALQRMQREVGRLTNVPFLCERMASSCRDVLQSEVAALYLRDGKTNSFRLMAADGASSGLPMQVAVPEELVKTLAVDPTLQRVNSGSRDNLSPVQSTLRQLKADLLHGLEMDGELSGLVVLGPKQNGAMYSAEDLTFLSALGQITGVALHSAKVHQDVTQLNEDLRLKTERIAQQRQQIALLQAELAVTASNTPQPQEATMLRREGIIGHSPALDGVLETVRKVASSETSVLLRGESGTGKELLAKAIHENSPRREGPLISVHCAALSPGLLESELFGHVKGAFTGAHADRRGRFEMAHGGTLFLDEIGDITAETQIKLLRVLQQREFEPVGGAQTIQVDVRLIAATHQNLERLIAEGRFREDLYYRLNVISVTLPPLRERSDDILELAVSFLKRAASRAGKRVMQFEEDAVSLLSRYSWPGNIRELQNVIERAVVLAEGDTVTVSDLPPDIQNVDRPSTSSRLSSSSVQQPDSFPSRSTSATRAFVSAKRTASTSSFDGLGDDPQAERRILLEALELCDGNKAAAARHLGLPRGTYYSKLKKHGLTDDTPLSATKPRPR